MQDTNTQTKVFIKAITRADYDSWPAVVRFFSPPFDVLAVDHYETHTRRGYRYQLADLLDYFSSQRPAAGHRAKKNATLTKHTRPVNTGD